MSTQGLFKLGAVALAASLIATLVCIQWLDVPIARFFFAASGHVSGLANAFGTAEMVGGDCLLMLVLAVLRVLRGSLPPFGKAIFIACGTSLCAFMVNDYVLKMVFGRIGVYTFLGNLSAPQFHFFHGDRDSVFPSGHMVMSAAFAAVLVRLYPRSWPLFAGLLALGAFLLLIGDWHFLGDIVAGIFMGGMAGFLVGEIWSQHGRHPRPS